MSTSFLPVMFQTDKQLENTLIFKIALVPVLQSQLPVKVVEERVGSKLTSSNSTSTVPALQIS